MDAALKITMVEGRALAVAGDDIDTDRITPARYLRAITFEGMEKCVFEDDRKAANGAHPFDDPRKAGSSVLVVNKNFGCGSSREHAPQAIHRWGIQVIVGESFSEIFSGNSAVIGLPLVTASAADVQRLMAAVDADPSATVRVDLTSMTCTWPGGSCGISMPAAVRESFVSGTWDTTGLLLDRYDEVRAVADRLPYVSGFSA